jgi:hypothetical protein
MNAEEIARLIFSFLGGGLVAAILNWVRVSQSERSARRLEFIRMQLQDLYGPLQFFTSSNARFFELNRKFHNAYKLEYIEKTWSQQYNTQERVKEEANQTIDIANQYIERVVQNNERILEILINNYSLIEPSDTEIFAQFIIDYTRYKTEIDKAGRLETPFRIYEQLGDISFMRPEFIEAVDRQFKEKKAKLEKLLK